MGTEARPRLLLDWGEELVRVRRREAALAAGVLHLALLVLLLISPRFFSRVLSPAEAEELARRQLTLLYLPSDLQKIPEPTPQPELTPEERQRMSLRQPLTLDPRDLQMALPPPAPPSASTAPPSSAGGDNQPASRAPSAPSGQTQASRGQGEGIRLENVPRPTRSPSSAPGLPMSSPGRALEDTLRQSAGQGGAGAPGGPGEAGPIVPNLNTPFPIILSDTRGVDFSPYLIRLLREVRRNWYATIPESARWGEQGKVVIIFAIEKDGSVPQGQPTLVQSSGRTHLDRPAVAAIRASQPFPPLPAEFTGPRIVLQFTFLYNLPLDYTGP